MSRTGPTKHQQYVEEACDLAEAYLDRFERFYPNDLRPDVAIVAARQWVNGTDGGTIVSSVGHRKACLEAYGEANAAAVRAWEAGHKEASIAAQMCAHAAMAAYASNALAAHSELRFAEQKAGRIDELEAEEQSGV